jgi:tripartite-type tricarboxylate transporter receptor subunit TctC
MTDLTRRHMVGGSATLAATVLAAPALAQISPQAGKTFKLITPFPAGGATDVLARLMAARLGEVWNATIVVENKPGAGGNIGFEQAAKAAPDTRTLLIASVGLATNRYLYAKLNYDPEKDLDPITLMVQIPNIVVGAPNLPFNTVPELIADTSKPGKYTYGSSGIGTSLHLAGELFQTMTGTQMVHAPYRGSAQALNDLMGGRIELMFDNMPSALPQVRGGNIKAFAVTTAKRSSSVPELPALAETVPGFDVSAWFGFWAPPGTPKDFVNAMQADVKKVLAEPAFRARLDELGAEPAGWTPEETKAFLRTETEKWGKLITEKGLKAAT